MKYATVLLEHVPKETTQLFIDYYTGQYRPKQDAIVVPEAPNHPLGIQPLGYASSAVQNLAALLPLPYMNSSSVQSPPSAGPQPTTVSQAHIVETNLDGPPAEYDVPKPRTAFSAFVDHPGEFVIFLEACVKSENLDEADKTDLYTTLFEMYLHGASSRKDGDKEELENKAKLLIGTKQIPIDASNVLLLSNLENFRDGSILVREQQGLRFDIFRSYTSAKDTSGAIKALRKYGPEEPQLYPAALAYFTSTPEIMAEAGDEIDTVLKKIDTDGLMAPLQVIQTLSSNGVATMGMIKRYLSTNIERERIEIANNRRLIETFQTDTEAKQKEISELGTKPAVFQATRCSACGHPLDLPTVHFLCKHSFHQHCLNMTSEDEDIECPIDAGQNATIRAIRKAQDESAERHDMFLDALSRSRNKFATVSEWFGRGVMSAAPVVE